jgi:tetratricopeptide (TPR) repeat protein
LLLRGTTLLKMQQYREAADDFSRLIELDPAHSSETYYNRGMLYSVHTLPLLRRNINMFTLLNLSPCNMQAWHTQKSECKTKP